MHDTEVDDTVISCYAAIDKEGRILFKVGGELKYIDLFESKEDDVIITSPDTDLITFRRIIEYHGNGDEIIKEFDEFLKIQKIVGKNKFIIE